jgi:hypothetical protein
VTLEDAIRRYVDKLPSWNPGHRYGYGYETGRRWAKIFAYTSATKTDRSVVVFVDAATGALHKAESWKKAGRPLGGNIFEAVARGGG